MAMAKTVLKIDEKELHRLTIPYKEYFGVMYITPDEMRKRIRLAEEIEDAMLWVFAYWLIAMDAELPIAEIKADAKAKLTEVISKNIRLDPYLEKHISDVVDDVIDSTAKHTRDTEDTGDDGGGDGSYWTSRDRAMLIAENEANAFEEYSKFRDAKASGKTKKTWITELDDKVRMTHAIAEGQTVDIDGLFLIGGSEMRFPKDTEYDPNPSEIVNCRCTCEYK